MMMFLIGRRVIMSKRDRKLKIIMLAISILEMVLTPFASHNVLIFVCIIGWFNVATLHLCDLLDNKGGN